MELKKAANVAGGAIGAMFFIGFGAAWISSWAVDSFQHPWELVAAIIALSTLLFFASLRRYQSNREAFKEESRSPSRRKISKTFNVINAAQWILIIGTAFVLPKIGFENWVQAAVIFIIGVHFLPLAALFKVRRHFVTGIVLIAWSLAYPFLCGGGPDSPAGRLGIGVVLWLSAIWTLWPLENWTQLAPAEQ